MLGINGTKVTTNNIKISQTLITAVVKVSCLQAILYVEHIETFLVIYRPSCTSNISRHLVTVFCIFVISDYYSLCL